MYSDVGTLMIFRLLMRSSATASPSGRENSSVKKENHQRVAKAVLHGKHELHKRVEIVEIPHESLRKREFGKKQSHEKDAFRHPLFCLVS